MRTLLTLTPSKKLLYHGDRELGTNQATKPETNSDRNCRILYFIG